MPGRHLCHLHARRIALGQNAELVRHAPTPTPLAPGDDLDRPAVHDLTDDLTPDVKATSLNARQQPEKAIEAGRLLAGAGRIVISLRAERVTAGSDSWPPDGDYVRIAVRDDGPGMSEEVHQRAFEPFFTTKPPGQGTGLGLAQIHGFAHQSNGTVTIDSAPGQGTEVTILLPRSELTPADRGQVRDVVPQAPAGRGETVLLVEDDPAVRGVIAATLAELGYQVLEAEDADAALATFKATAGVDAVVTDLTMPGSMDGMELAEAVRSSSLELPVILVTGHLDPLCERRLPDGVTFLQKPCTRAQLANALQNALVGVAKTVQA